MKQKTIEWGTEKISVLFGQVFFPTLLGMLGVSAVTTIDGIFIGHGVGSNGIAAVNICVPLLMVLTGFGLMGHLLEMCQGSGLAARVDTKGIDLIGAAMEFARMGVLPAGLYRNRSFAESSVDAGEVELAVQDLLFDPQTSGGLLMAADPGDAESLLADLRGCVPSAQRVGELTAYRGGARICLR